MRLRQRIDYLGYYLALGLGHCDTLHELLRIEAVPKELIRRFEKAIKRYIANRW